MTTLQNVIQYIRRQNIIPVSHVNGGITDDLAPPYIGVLDYQHTEEYDTAGPVVKEAAFKVVVLERNCDLAEELAEKVDAVMNNQKVTAQTIGMFQDGYISSQTEAKLYQWAVEITYRLQESLRA